MPAVVFYFQMHQPFRLRRYSVFDSDPFYFDDAQNAQIIRKVAAKSYLPTTRLLLEMVRRHEGLFRFSLSVSGCALEQMELYCPEVLEQLRALAATGCVEFLGETYHHSLAAVYSPREFAEQVELHARAIKSLLGVEARVFRNTELIYSNAIASLVAGLTDESGHRRFIGMLAEGTDANLGYRSANFVYRPPRVDGHEVPSRVAGKPLALLLRNYKLSDDIAFRFSARDWPDWPLTPEKFAGWVHQVNREGQVCNLFMDFECFGEHQWAETGIFQFLEALPQRVLALGPGQNEFVTASQAIERFAPAAEFDVPATTSWADRERDLSAWTGNAMQAGATEELYKLEALVKRDTAPDTHRSPRLPGELTPVEAWRRLTTSDHVYYMSTKGLSDGQVHKYFSPFDSPYDAYINFMNVLDNLKRRGLA